jgi:hypothetical protein
VIDGKNFPFLRPIMESFGEKSEKTCLTEFSGIPAYTPYLYIRQSTLRQVLENTESTAAL